MEAEAFPFRRPRYLLATYIIIYSVSKTASASPARWGGLYPVLSSANRLRNIKLSSLGYNSGSTECGACNKSYVLDESDFEDDDFSDDDGECSDDESILWTTKRAANYFRGGAAAVTSRAILPGIHSGWRKKQNRQSKTSRRNSLQQKQRQQIEQLQSIQQQKMRQFRKLFRQKQRQFQNSLYNLNSRLNGPGFPKPPYSLWQLDTEPAIGKTTLTGKIFLLNIAVFGLQTMMPQLTAMGAKRSDMILEGRQLYRLVTPIFLHGGIGHLMANSYSLKSMGVNVERAYGQRRLFATYLISGVMGNVLSAIQSPNPAVGASGAIFGLVGAYYTFLSRNQHLFGYTGQMQKSALIETIGINLLMGRFNPMIDNWGHIGGFLGGVGCAWLFGPKLYVVRVPLGEDNMMAGGFGAGKLVIDRPTVAFRTPDFVDDGIYWVNDNMKRLGRRVTGSVRGLFNGGGVQEYFLDKNVDISMGSTSNGGDGTIYRILKGDDVPGLEGNSVNVTPSDGFRQDVSELDPLTVRQRERQRQRRAVPKSGHSIRPRYGHLYR